MIGLVTVLVTGAALWRASASLRSGGPLLLFALAPAGGDYSPDRDLEYPPGTHLMGLRLGKSPAELAPGWEVTSRPDASYDGRSILFPGRRIGAEVSQVWELEPGRPPRQVVHYGGDCANPLYLPDGRIVFSGRSRDEKTGISAQAYALFTFGPSSGRLDRITFGCARDRALAVLRDGRILFRRLPLDASRTGGEGRLLTVDPDGTALSRYASAAPAADARTEHCSRIFSVKRGRNGEHVLVETYSRRGPQPEVRYARDGYHAVDPVFVAPRKRQAVASSIVNLAEQRGRLLCLDVFRSESTRRPAGSRIRIREAADGTVLGEAPIAEDGSVYLDVPADRLLRLEIVDTGGRTLRAMKTGIWVRPNENRGCIGCHEPPYLSPENRAPRAIEHEPALIGPAWLPRPSVPGVAEGRDD